MSSRDWLNRNVAGMTLTSFFSDACYEMVLSVLPGFFAAAGISAAALGWIEGAADAFASFLKLWTGWYSDRIGRRKPIVVIGYFLTGTGMSLFAFATGWPLILFGRMWSWFGKGIRGSLRDALLSESVPEQFQGRAFGFHRAGDTVGAILGPLAGIALLHWLPAVTPDAPFRTIFLCSLIPGLLSPLSFLLIVGETQRGTNKAKLWAAVNEIPAAFRKFLVAAGIFGIGDYSPTLLILAATVVLTPAHGKVAAASIAAGLYLLRNVMGALAAYPIGTLSDRMHRGHLLATGYLGSALVAASAAAVFHFHVDGIPALAAIFALAGVVAACQDTVSGAVPASMVTPRTRGTAYGVMGFINGFGDLIASAVTGTVWTAGSPVLAFGLAASFMLLGAFLMWRVPCRPLE